ncbi:hypothetical protein C8F01DRAFT_1000121, partial [Mycena amicta]
LCAVEQKIYLHQCAVSTGFSANTTGARVIRLGVNARYFFYCCSSALLTYISSEWLDRAASARGDPVEALYERLERYAQSPLLLVFVIAGPRYRSFTGGHKICGRGHSLTRRFKTIIEGFGFQWFTAAGEAEATLAHMTTTGIPVRVDAVLTENWDVFAHGASHVMRMYAFFLSCSNNKKQFTASLYSAADIEDWLGFSQADFIFIALASGPGYCGIATAVALARAGFGRKLIAGVSGKSRNTVGRFLILWRQEIRQELVSNSSGHLPVSRRNVPESLPSSFPDPDILNLFLQPAVSGPVAGLSSRFLPLDIHRLAAFARRNFNWGHPTGLLQRFSQRVFPALVIRALLIVQLSLDASTPSPRPAILDHIVGERVIASTGHVRELCIVLSVRRGLLMEALRLHNTVEVDSWMNAKLANVQVWVPRVMVESVDPAFVLDFVCCT